MRNREIFMVSALSFSVGVIWGFLISPAKGGFVNNSRNTTNNYYANYNKNKYGRIENIKKESKE